jgi:hypothetical protein
MKRLLAAALITLAILAAGTHLLGELVDGAVLYTRDVDGEWIGTKLWVADYDGAVWVRVARPSRRWYQRLLVDPIVELERGGVRTRHRAVPHPEPEARTALDAVFRLKNGRIDWWYGVLLRSDAIPIELAPAP